MTSDRDLTERADAVEPDVSSDEEETSLDDVVETGPSELERISTERDEYLDALRRLQAEFENYRKRTMRQQTELLERATESLLEKLLPVLDAFDLALAHQEPATTGSSDGAFVQIAALLRDVLAKEGLERIDDEQVVFDPTIHDAVAHVERERSAVGDDPAFAPGATDEELGAPHHVVIEVLRAGYLLKGRVLRPAMVKVEG